MAVERTFSIIKPDATRRNLTGKINARFEEKGLRIVAQKRIWMSRQQAEQFYGVHKERPFFKDLVDFMISGPVMVQGSFDRLEIWTLDRYHAVNDAGTEARAGEGAR